MMGVEIFRGLLKGSVPFNPNLSQIIVIGMKKG